MWLCAMSSAGFCEPIELRPHELWPLIGWGLLLGLLAAASIAVSELATRWKLAGLVATLMGISLGLRRCGGRRLERAVLYADGSWRLFPAHGEATEAQLVRAWGWTAGPVIALEWRTAAGVHWRTWLLRATVDARSWRRLRVRLRLA